MAWKWRGTIHIWKYDAISTPFSRRLWRRVVFAKSLYYRGTFKGQQYDFDQPPSRHFKNNISCRQFSSFVQETFIDRLNNGAVYLKGRVGEIDLPSFASDRWAYKTTLMLWCTLPKLVDDRCFVFSWYLDWFATLFFLIMSNSIRRQIWLWSFSLTVW